MKVITVFDIENSDNICVAIDIPTAINYLVQNGWLYDDLEIWSAKDMDYISLAYAYHTNWKKVLSNMSVIQLNDIFENMFDFAEEDLIGAP